MGEGEVGSGGEGEMGRWGGKPSSGPKTLEALT